MVVEFIFNLGEIFLIIFNLLKKKLNIREKFQGIMIEI